MIYNASMTPRDHFAGLAMQMLMFSLQYQESRAELVRTAIENKISPSDQIAKMAYEQADAMIDWEASHARTP